jgi:phosphoadenosine phosphosulfate reductase
MYSYKGDEETGGYRLIRSQSKFSKEPRPVYYKELDILGFDDYWNYEKDDSYPYMWAEANSYFYRDKLVAKTKGGTLYTKPEIIFLEEPEPDKGKLKFVDIPNMVSTNKEIMDSLVNETIKSVYNTFVKYKDIIDVFYVAFSGGKDSVALLDIVQRALPHNAFKVIFGDTQMENEDTYKFMERMREYCKIQGIDFHTVSSQLDIKDSWSTFGYPSSKLRWCCGVHKTTPQITFLRKELNKADFKGMAFVGVRRDESITRSKYETISEGEKHEGQYSFNVIDEWNSAELFLYTYGNGLMINESYKKGHARVGCIVCPMSSGKNEYMKMQCYPEQVNSFISLIKEKSNRQFDDKSKEKEFIENGGWKVRNNGRDLKVPPSRYEEILKGTMLHILLGKNSIWKEWMKTLGELNTADNKKFTLICAPDQKNDIMYEFEVFDNGTQLEFEILGKPGTRQDIRFLSLFKSVLKKSAYCVKCRECEANCSNGCITMFPEFKITNCKHCFKCHNIDSGCLLYNSIKILKGVERNMSLDCYASFGVEKSWVNKYLEHKEKFWQSEYNDLGSMKITALKRFLRDAKIKMELSESNSIAIRLNSLYDSKIDEEIFWALIFVNVSYAPQLNWFVKNTNIGERYLVDEIKEKLGEGNSKGTNNNIVSSLKNIFLKTPIGQKLKIGICGMNEKGSKIIAFTRGKWESPDPKVVLYALYKFAEACGDYYQFTLTRLINFSIDSDGVSPAQMFGLDRETMEKLLNGLTINYNEFISCSFTLDLDNITLRSDKTSEDVLDLFKEV